MACIQDEERERINKFVFSNDASLSLVSKNTSYYVPLYYLN